MSVSSAMLGLRPSVEPLAGITLSRLLDGNITTPAGIETVIDVVLHCRDEATTSTPPVSGQTQNVKHLAGTSCIVPPTCGFQAHELLDEGLGVLDRQLD
jgi:hypothetical protein